MNCIENFDKLQILIANHFSYVYSSEEIILSDHYSYILPGLLGIPKGEVLFTQFQIPHYPASNSQYSDPLLQQLGEIYMKRTGIDLSNIVFHKTFRHDSFRAFIQSIDDDKSIIEFWIGASAVIGVLAIVIAQYIAFIHAGALFPKNNKRHIEEEQLFLNKLINLKRLATSWNRDKQITIDCNSELELRPETSKIARNIFLASIEFALNHELAHHFKGHVRNNNNTSIKQMKYNELEADIDSISKSINNYRIGPLVCFMAASILQDSDDSSQSSTHPSLIERVQNYFNTLIDLSNDKETTIKEIKGSFLPIVRTIFGNLDDRDRFPDWFGYSKKEFESNIKYKHQLNQVFKTSDFQTNDIYNILDSSKPKARKKKITIDFI